MLGGLEFLKGLLEGFYKESLRFGVEGLVRVRGLLRGSRDIVRQLFGTRMGVTSN